MAEQTPQDQIQPLPLIKRMFGLAETESLGCAFSLTKDKKDCILLVDKLAKGKKVANKLKTDGKAFVDLPSMRFGHVHIDVPTDPSTVIFTVNRAEAGGTITHLLKLVKKGGYQALVINADESLEAEPEDGVASAGAPPPPPPMPAAEAPIDAAALKARLTALVQKMMAVITADPSRRDALLALAKEAQVLLGTNNLKSATVKTDEFEAAIGDGGAGATAAAQPTGPTGAAPAGPVAYAKSRLAWIATRQKLDGELGKLRAQLQAEYKDEPDGGEILQAYDTRVAPVLAALDSDLADKLDEATNATDPAVRAKLVGEAKMKIKVYKTYLDGEPLIKDLDENPFVPLAIRTMVGATLTALDAAVH